MCMCRRKAWREDTRGRVPRLRSSTGGRSDRDRRSVMSKWHQRCERHTQSDFLEGRGVTGLTRSVSGRVRGTRGPSRVTSPRLRGGRRSGARRHVSPVQGRALAFETEVGP